MFFFTRKSLYRTRPGLTRIIVALNYAVFNALFETVRESFSKINTIDLDVVVAPSPFRLRVSTWAGKRFRTTTHVKTKEFGYYIICHLYDKVKIVFSPGYRLSTRKKTLFNRILKTSTQFVMFLKRECCHFRFGGIIFVSSLFRPRALYWKHENIFLLRCPLDSLETSYGVFLRFRVKPAKSIRTRVTMM